VSLDRATEELGGKGRREGGREGGEGRQVKEGGREVRKGGIFGLSHYM